VSVDPLQHEYPHYTPYQYAGNKPITFIDLDGLEEYYSLNGSLIKASINSNDNRIFVEKIKEVIIVNHYQAIDKVATQMIQARPFGSEFSIIKEQTFSEIAPWMQKAFGEMQLGVKEGTGSSETSPKKYLNYKGVPEGMRSMKESTHWCAAFVNYVLEESDYIGESVNPLAVQNWNGTWRSWEEGKQIENPSYGALVTLGDRHIGFVVGISEDGKNLFVLGGNQSDEINVSMFPIKDDFQYFLPKDYEPYDFESDTEFLRQSYKGTIKKGGSVR
jgi:uncharacterized protein (TIGR02594 family)